MATGAAFLVLMLWLSQDPSLGDNTDSQVAATEDLTALVPAAAAATVAAGYINTSSDEALTFAASVSVTAPSTMTVVFTNHSGASSLMIKPEDIEVTDTTPNDSEVSGGLGTSASPGAASSGAVESSLEQLENSLQNLGASMLALTTIGPETGSTSMENPPGPLTNGSEYVSSPGGEVSSPGGEVITSSGPGAVGAPVQVVTVGTIEDSNGIVGTPVEVATMEVVTEFGPGSTPKEEVLVVGDARYRWQDWSPWHCNCPVGSMSRVRDIAYSVQGVHLDPIQYNVLRFERQACNYDTCGCSKEAHQCDRLEVPCKEPAAHLCALKDLEFDKQQKRTDFWSHVHVGLKNLWNSMKDAFPQSKVPRVKLNKKTAPSIR